MELGEYVKECGSELIGLIVSWHQNDFLNLEDQNMSLSTYLSRGAIKKGQYKGDTQTKENIDYFNTNISPLLKN